MWVIGDVDAWLATSFSHDRIKAVLEDVAAGDDEHSTQSAEIRSQIATCERNLKQYRVALEAGSDPVEVTKWINEVQQKRGRLEGQLRALPRGERPDPKGVSEILERAADLTQLVIKADTTEKAELYKQLGLKMTYYPQRQLVEVQIVPEPPDVRSVRVRGGTHTIHPRCIAVVTTYEIEVIAA